MVEKINKFLDGFVVTIQLVMSVIIIIMTLSNVLQVCTRYFISYQVMWVEDISILGLYWLFALGTPMAWILGKHLDMNAFEGFMSKQLKIFLWYLMQIVGFLGGIALVIIGSKSYQMNNGFVMSVVGFDESFRYVPLMVCGALMTFVCLILVIRAVMLQKEGKTNY